MSKNQYVIDINTVAKNFIDDFSEDKVIDVKLKIKSLFQKCERTMQGDKNISKVIYEMVAELDNVMYSYWKDIAYPAYKLDENSRPSEEQFLRYVSKSSAIYEIINCAVEAVGKIDHSYAVFYNHMIEIAETLLVAKGYEIKKTLLKKYKAVPVCELSKGKKEVVEIDLNSYRKKLQSITTNKVESSVSNQSVVKQASSQKKEKKPSVDANKVVLTAAASYAVGKAVSSKSSGKKSEMAQNKNKEKYQAVQQSARDNQVYATYSKTNKCCATCQFFWGEREIDNRTKKVIIRKGASKPAKCNKSLTSNNTPGSSCSRWKGI
ncbi:MAG: hypothetical protein SOW12_08270 [Lachnospiraceae bacterium]|nr:hypothetical protein [Lachnoclostridium sp.]MDY2599908.1 hypothetical protein [Lachnospiraceae bacterium]MDY5728547.1 hypothetical protein [Erysipelotrichaceae bacterium]